VATETSTGKSRANIRIPLGAINTGMKMDANFTTKIDGIYNDQISKAFHSGNNGQILDIFDDKGGEHIEVHIE
jgi:hypothetical protein